VANFEVFDNGVKRKDLPVLNKSLLRKQTMPSFVWKPMLKQQHRVTTNQITNVESVMEM
jgi:hypothetical protein